MDKQMLEKHARLVVKIGVNLQPKQLLVITSPIECAEFTRLVAQAAYEAGAKDVIINWQDELFTKMRFLQAPEEVFEEFPEWRKQFYLHYMKQGAAFLSIAATDPELLKDVNPERVAKSQRTNNIALQEYRENMMSNKNVWSVVSIPTVAWASKVFPDLDSQQAVEALWTEIFKTVRVDQADPIAAWQQHKQVLKTRTESLNAQAFKSLHFKNSQGTDITIELPTGHVWFGGSEYTPSGLEFAANMPTEEVYTLPSRKGINGLVVSSKPLNYHGNLIDNFSLEFKDGKIVDFTAERGYETLKQLIETDEGSHYLGEVALVPYDSPISNSNILFFNTLFDENASCHLAIGKAYPVCLKDGATMTKEQLEQRGVNDSLVHVDFMIGTADLEITGVTPDGRQVQVFVAGNFTAEFE